AFGGERGYGAYGFRLGALEDEGVQEVEAGIQVELAEQAGAGGRAAVVPPHVGLRQPSRRLPRSERPDVTVDPAEARPLALVAAAGEHLHRSEERRVGKGGSAGWWVWV